MKNGFTLIELIAVIALLSLFGIVITINIGNNISKNKEEECNNFIKEIETSACVYESTHECNESICEVTLKELMQEGLLNSKKDKCTNDDIDYNKEVFITRDEMGEKHCEYRR